ncbi:MAG: hypothetical protein M1827_004850 [Pycnora praestabilis]|nr:MAG: hypothetical protein M1827_004850 [Pycnora praestabilis]
MATVSKTEPLGEGSCSSIGSSPEPDAEIYTPENAQIQKRKGGRKPIYATSEERKQRNRQAQAAFRERRTEYIKQLETTIKHHEETLQNLQQSHRSAADECLMLRYKNSLLERILLEKGIDVQAELRAKTGSPHLGQQNAALAPVSQQPPIQRAIMNRHHQARRSASGVTPKIEPGNAMSQTPREAIYPNRSPQLQPTPPSHISSPTTSRSPGFAAQGVMTPPVPDLQAQQMQQHQQQQQRPQPPLKRTSQPHHHSPLHDAGHLGPTSESPRGSTGGTGTGSSAGVPNAYYPSPFQNHIDQLEQEYDAQADMLDDQDPSDHSAGPGPYPQTFEHQVPHGIYQQYGPRPQIGQPQQMIPPAHQPSQQMTAQPGDTITPVSGATNQLFDPFDPTLDADPFGLSASMHFPTQFTFETSSMR